MRKFTVRLPANALAPPSSARESFNSIIFFRLVTVVCQVLSNNYISQGAKNNNDNNLNNCVNKHLPLASLKPSTAPNKWLTIKWVCGFAASYINVCVRVFMRVCGISEGCFPFRREYMPMLCVRYGGCNWLKCSHMRI